jgi:hypothetical protein
MRVEEPAHSTADRTERRTGLSSHKSASPGRSWWEYGLLTENFRFCTPNRQPAGRASRATTEQLIGRQPPLKKLNSGIPGPFAGLGVGRLCRLCHTRYDENGGEFWSFTELEPGVGSEVVW